jgi:branched-chain amino acid transport system ATP-binding protein
MLDVDGIHTSRGAVQVLRGVSLRVAAGEVVCLVGRNGAGKTTTLESIMGILAVRAGHVRLDGRDVTRLPSHERAALGVGYAPEHSGVFPDLTVAENLAIAGWLGRRRPGTRLPRLFPEIESFMQRRGLNLSGGQKKMVAISRALALSPAVLLLDEPFEGLAPVVVTRFIEAARTIRSLGIALLIAESNLHNAVRAADRLYAIDRGEIIFEGHPDAVFTNEEVMRTIRG